MADALSTILETTQAERLATGNGDVIPADRSIASRPGQARTWT